MASAILRVKQAGPHVSVQDAGRHGYQRYGVTESGPMDRTSFKIANFAVGNKLHAAAVEISLGGIELECINGSVLAAVAGGKFDTKLDGKSLPTSSVFTLATGSSISVRPGEWGSWCYLAFAGKVVSPTWLGSQSVHLNSGLCGKPFVRDDVISVENSTGHDQPTGQFLPVENAQQHTTIRVVLGPQDYHFDDQAIADLLNKKFTLTPDYNRMGVRLSGPKLSVRSRLDMPSQAIARGSLQVPGDGDPIALLADHQTTGGYPKIATIVSCDQDKFTQLRAGDFVRFQRCDVTEAVQAARDGAIRLSNLFKKISANRINLEQRLIKNNLISGVIDGGNP